MDECATVRLTYGAEARCHPPLPTLFRIKEILRMRFGGWRLTDGSWRSAPDRRKQLPHQVSYGNQFHNLSLASAQPTAAPDAMLPGTPRRHPHPQRQTNSDPHRHTRNVPYLTLKRSRALTDVKMLKGMRNGQQGTPVTEPILEAHMKPMHTPVGYSQGPLFWRNGDGWGGGSP